MSPKNRKLLITIMVIAMLVVLPLISFLFLRSGKGMWDDRKVPAYELIDQNGEVFSSNRWQGKVHVASFLYSTCDDPYCDSVLVTQQWLQEQLGGDPDLMQLTFSIDPEVDSLPVLQDWAATLGADTSFWHFITGSKPEIAKIVVAGYMITKLRFREPRFSGLKASPKIILIGKDGFIKGFYKTQSTKHREKLLAAIKEQLAI